jgi:hypothetical protein
MFRKPAFWLVFGLISAAAALYALRNFSVAFPLVSVDIHMDRTTALATARTMAARYAWPPKEFNQAASFGGDPEVQNFVELEGGGKDALRRMIVDHTYAPYTWTVRNFKEGDAHEVEVSFTPEGDPFGFAVRLPENEKGASLDAAQARSIAEHVAVEDWHVDLSKYPLVESSEQIRPSGRKDHEFVYERQDIRLGEGRYRLRLVVSGDKLTGLAYFIQIPEAFKRRYSEMRSANDAISTFGTVGFAAYLLGFCCVGLFFMIRQRWLIWRPAIVAAVLIAGIVALGDASQWPLRWMEYDTALPATGFALRQIALIAGTFLANTLLFSISFMAAETLSRKAFPNHPQFWRVWSRPAANSRQVLGRTLAGYLAVSLAIVYIIVFYGFTQRRFGWWSPSDTLVDPNVFASYFPSLSAVSQAAQAGFWEECLFRAVPLAAFALIGDRFHKRRAFLVAGFIVQWLVFGSGHAGYANQPSYARVVELIVPSSAFAAYFLAFGLLPGIVMHYTFDAILMSLPIFAASNVRAHIDAILVVGLILIPLWIVLIARLRSGRWSDLPEGLRNRGWSPPALEEPTAQEVVEERKAINAAVQRVLPIVALAGLVVWLLATHFRADVPGISISRATAESTARQALAQRGVQLDSSWTLLSRVSGQPNENDFFVWQRGGPKSYQVLMGSYLPPPHWVVRFARFQGDVAQRAEEYQVAIAGDGQEYRIRHQLAEATPGATLTEEQARSLALSTIQEDFGVTQKDVAEISAEARKLPARGDWTVEYKDTRNYGLPEGEPRLAVEIAGDKVADANRYVHVPEEWARNERSRRNLPDILSIAMTVFSVGLVIAGTIIAAIRWSRGSGFSIRGLRWIGGFVLLIGLLSIPNGWKETISRFSTAQPYMIQVGMVLTLSLVAAVVIAAGLGLVAGFVSDKYSRVPCTGRLWLTGVSLGVIVSAMRALATRLAPSFQPVWPDFAAAGTSIPFVAAAVGPFSGFITLLLVLSLLFEAIDHTTRRWVRRRFIGGILFLILGLLLVARSIETIPSWLAGGVLVGATLWAAYVLVLRFQPRTIFPMVATLSALSVVHEAFYRAYSGALIGGVLAVSIIAASVALVFDEGRPK